MHHPARILVIRFSSIGDIVLTTPVIRALKEQLDGGAEIHFLTKKKYAYLFEAHPLVSQIHTIEQSVQEILPELEKIHFDYIIDLHNNIRSTIVKRRLRVLSFTFRKLNFRKWLWVNLRINLMPAVHVVDRYMKTIEIFKVKDDGKGLDYYIPDGKGLSPDSIPDTHRNGFIAFAIGGAHIGKRMDGKKLTELCAAIPFPVVLLGGESDKATANAAKEICGDKVWNTCGKLSVHQSADVIRQAQLVIAGDTGMAHIASAFGKKIISLWGCTVPGFGMSPYRPHPDSVSLEPIHLKRRPCSKLGNRCKYGTAYRCIQHIENSEIIRAIERLLVQRTKP